MNRREFIKQGTGAFFIAAADRVLGAGAASNRVRLAIIGCREGGRGFCVMQNAIKVPGVEIAVVCDVDSRALVAAAAKIKELTGVEPRKEKDVRKVLAMSDVDGILCVTPDHWHAWIAWAAMKAGKAVYVEKPCAFCPAECELLIRTQKKTGRVLQVGSQRRSSDSVAAAIAAIPQLIGEPRHARCWYSSFRAPIGKGKEVAVPDWLDWDLWQGPAPRTEYRDNVVHYNWHWFRRWGTSEMGNNSPHFLDIARWGMKLGFPQRVTAGGGHIFRTQPDWEWPDFHNVTYEYPDGKVVTWECTSSAGYMPYMGNSTGCVLHNEDYALYFAANDSAALYDRRDKLVKEWKNPEEDKTKVGSVTNPVDDLDTKHMAKFVSCIRANDVRTNAPADEAHKSTILSHLGNIALLTGETVRLDPATGKLQGTNGAELWSREYAKGWELV